MRETTEITEELYYSIVDETEKEYSIIDHLGISEFEMLKIVEQWYLGIHSLNDCNVPILFTESGIELDSLITDYIELLD